VSRKEVDVISVSSKDQIIVRELKFKVDLKEFLENQHFKFDYTFDETDCNDVVYNYTAKPLVQTIFERGMAICFPYGETESRKTHTMGRDCQKGSTPWLPKTCFRFLRSPMYEDLTLTVSVSFFEIYSGEVLSCWRIKPKCVSSKMASSKCRS
jgi:kinesin family protein 2/24